MGYTHFNDPWPDVGIGDGDDTGDMITVVVAVELLICAGWAGIAGVAGTVGTPV